MTDNGDVERVANADLQCVLFRAVPQRVLMLAPDELQRQLAVGHEIGDAAPRQSLFTATH